MDRWILYAKHIKRLDVHREYFGDQNINGFFAQALSVFGIESMLSSLRVLQFEVSIKHRHWQLPDFAAILSASVRKIQLLIQGPMDRDDIESFLGIITERCPNLVSLAMRPHPRFERRVLESNKTKLSLDQPSNFLINSLARPSRLQSLTIPSYWATDPILGELKKLPSLGSLDCQDFLSSSSLHTPITSLLSPVLSSMPTVDFPSLSCIFVRGAVDKLEHLLEANFKGCKSVHRLSLLADQKDMAGVTEYPPISKLAALVSENFPQLQVLSLESQGKSVDFCLNGDIVRMFTSCTLLTVIEFVGIDYIDADALITLSKAWPNVRALTLVSNRLSQRSSSYEETFWNDIAAFTTTPTSFHEWFKRAELDPPGMTVLSLMAERLPRLERLIISVYAEPAPQLLWPFESLTYLELRSSFLNYMHGGLTTVSAAKYLSSLLRPEGKFVFKVDTSLDSILYGDPDELWYSYMVGYKTHFAAFQETVNAYLEGRNAERVRVGDRGGLLSREKSAV
jgi:hypothetical protein